METTVGIRELKANLSAYLQKVKEGATIVITEHGKPIGRLTPLPKSRQERIQAMIDAGLIRWSGKKPQLLDESEMITLAPDAKQTVTEILLENRG